MMVMQILQNNLKLLYLHLCNDDADDAGGDHNENHQTIRERILEPLMMNDRSMKRNRHTQSCVLRSIARLNVDNSIQIMD